MPRARPSRSPRLLNLIAALLAAALAACPAARAQSTPPATSPPAATPVPPTPSGIQALTPELIQSKIDDLSTVTGLDAAAKDQALALYKTALTRLEAARTSEASAAAYRQAIESAPKDTAEARLRLAELAAAREAPNQSPDPTIAAATRAELEQRLTGSQLDAAAKRKTLTQLEEMLLAMQARPAAARQEIAEEKRQSEEIDRSIAAAPPAGESPVVSAARQTSLKARRHAGSKRTDELEQELLSLQPRQDLVTAQRDLAIAEAARADKLVEEIQKVLTEKRQQESRDQQAQAERTKREVASQHPAIVAYATENAALTEAWTELNRKIAAATRTQSAVKAQRDQLRDSEQSAKQLLEIGAVGEEYGLLLRELRAKLPNTARVESEIETRERAIIDARLKRLRLQDQLRALSDPEAAIERLVAALPPDVAASVTDQVKQTLRELMTARKETLTRFADGYDQYIKTLTNVNADAAELLSGNTALEAVLQERLLWLPSTASLGEAWWHDVEAGARWLSDGRAWAAVAVRIKPRLLALPILTGLVFLAACSLIVLRKKLGARVSAIAGQTKRISTDRFTHTTRTLLLTLLLTLPWPLLLGYLGGLLASEIPTSGFPSAVGMGLLGAAIVVFILRTFQVMCRKDGLFLAHFGWSERTCRRLGRELLWLMGVEAVSAFIVATCDAGGDDVYRNGLGRLAFLLGSLALTVFMYRVFNPRRGAVAEFVASKPILFRLRFLWYPLAIAAPAGPFLLAAMGYYETAAQVQSRVFTTGWVALLALIGYSLALRWLLVAQRRLALRQALDRREKSQAAKARAAADVPGEVPSIEEPKIDITTVSDQTRTLLRFVCAMSTVTLLWIIWSQLFPAIRVLDTIPLWSHAVSGPDGEKIVPITAWHVAIALLTAVITFVAARNLPGLVEIAVLERLSIASGTRYTIAAVTRYGIFTIGLLLAFNQLGADWSKMQWIAAALGVGLGFGLQEIVANFVSGLIILFEQPVRVGDLVTVGDRIGMVSRIQIRATTIIDPDNREVIIPNKAFITERVTNWALTDPVTRLVVNVGIAYGTDTTRAHRVLTETIKANPLVLQTPAPAVLFMGFGDSALNFEVRVYVREIADRIPLTHELHMAIHNALRANGIEIPFPQRDLHLRTAAAVITVAPPPPPESQQP